MDYVTVSSHIRTGGVLIRAICIGMCGPKGDGFQLFSSEIRYRFCLEFGMM